ncbi:MAG: EAL domain-containing protein, partial [Hyphomicrobiaceae bacterium]
IRADFRMRHVDNSYRWFELEAASVPTSDRRTVRCIGLMRDVTDVKIAHERLISNAVRCSLTGIPNRSLLLDRLGVVLSRSASDPTVRPTVMFIDIDKFKAVNATLGLNVGDSVLMTVARRLQRHLGPFDTLARVGGDQFVILFVEEQETRELAAIAERVRRSVRSPIAIANQEVVLTASYGISIYEGGDLKAEDLLREAEIAMFRAKRGGTDRIEIFKPEMRGDADDDASIAAIARKAIDKGQLKMLFQPIVYLPTEELAGFEAMVRFEHAKLGLLNPVGVLTSGNDADHLRKLTSMSLSLAIEAVTQWQKELPRPEDHLFVNLDIASGVVLRAELAQEVRHQLSPALIGKGTLRFEISERIVMENPEHAVSVLELLRGTGAEIVLDDFGSGFSSLAYLQRLPCDTFKIDRALMRIGTGSNESGSTVVRGMVALAHEMGRKAIAEGVETPDDVVFLRSIGCEYAQGYYYGEPMGERDVTQLLRIIRKSERKLQTHGFFKTKQRSAKKKRKREEKAETPATVAASATGEAGQGASIVPPGAAAVDGAIRNMPAAAGERTAPAAGAASALKTRQRPMSQRPNDPSLASPAPPMPPKSEAAMPPFPAPPMPAAPPPQPPARTAPPQMQSATTMPSPPNGAAPPRHDGTPSAPPQMPPAGTARPNPLPHEIAQPFPVHVGPPPIQPQIEPIAAAVDPIAPPVPPPLPSRPAIEIAKLGPLPMNGAQEPHVAPATAPPPMSPPAVRDNGPAPPRTARPANGGINGDGTPHQPPKRLGRVATAQPDFSTLPPGIAASLAKLAGVPPPTASRAADTREPEPSDT